MRRRRRRCVRWMSSRRDLRRRRRRRRRRGDAYLSQHRVFWILVDLSRKELRSREEREDLRRIKHHL
eukprot:168351-Hanusia_phi.AAC.1